MPHVPPRSRASFFCFSSNPQPPARGKLTKENLCDVRASQSKMRPPPPEPTSQLLPKVSTEMKSVVGAESGACCKVFTLHGIKQKVRALRGPSNMEVPRPSFSGKSPVICFLLGTNKNKGFGASCLIPGSAPRNRVVQKALQTGRPSARMLPGLVPAVPRPLQLTAGLLGSQKNRPQSGMLEKHVKRAPFPQKAPGRSGRSVLLRKLILWVDKLRTSRRAFIPFGVHPSQVVQKFVHPRYQLAVHPMLDPSKEKCGCVSFAETPQKKKEVLFFGFPFKPQNIGTLTKKINWFHSLVSQTIFLESLHLFSRNFSFCPKPIVFDCARIWCRCSLL